MKSNLYFVHYILHQITTVLWSCDLAVEQSVFMDLSDLLLCFSLIKMRYIPNMEIDAATPGALLLLNPL